MKPDKLSVRWKDSLLDWPAAEWNRDLSQSGPEKWPILAHSDRFVLEGTLSPPLSLSLPLFFSYFSNWAQKLERAASLKQNYLLSSLPLTFRRPNGNELTFEQVDLTSAYQQMNGGGWLSESYTHERYFLISRYLLWAWPLQWLHDWSSERETSVSLILSLREKVLLVSFAGEWSFSASNSRLSNNQHEESVFITASKTIVRLFIDFDPYCHWKSNLNSTFQMVPILDYNWKHSFTLNAV